MMICWMMKIFKGRRSRKSSCLHNQNPDRLMVRIETPNRISIDNNIHPQSLRKHVLLRTVFE